MPAVTAMPLTAGATFARFRIDEPLGKGGMAVVYKAYELHLERHVALKVLPAALLHEESFAQRFEREARIVAQLEHPHIVPIYNFGIDEGVPWMSMRLLAGGTLADGLNGRRFSTADVASVLEPIAAALDHAHAHGVVHRDVKPSNVMRDGFGHYYLTDFGIARMSAAATQLTVTGMMTGTPFYMSPEQATAVTVDGRSDIYSLGIVAYEMLTGAVPFTGDTPMAVMVKHTRDPLPAPDPGVLARATFAVLSTCLAKEPAARYATAAEFVRALKASGSVADDAAGDLRETKPTRSVPPPRAAQANNAPVTDAAAGPKRGRRRWTFAISITISLCALLVFSVTTLRRGSSAPPELTMAQGPRAPEPTATPAPPVPAPAATASPALPGRPSTAPAPARPGSRFADSAPQRPPARPLPGVEPAPPTQSATRPADAPPVPRAAPPSLTLRHDGSYRIDRNAAGRYTHFIFRDDGTCAIVAVRFPAVPQRAVAEASGPSCAYLMTGPFAAITITREGGDAERVMAFRSPDDTVMIRRQPTTFVPFVVR